MGYLKEIVDYGKAVERDRMELVASYRQKEAAVIVVASILLAGVLVLGLILLAQRDAQGWVELEKQS